MAKRERLPDRRVRRVRRALAARLGPSAAALTLVVGLATGNVAVAVAADPATERSAQLDDFDRFCRFVADEYAYFDVKKTDWPAACSADREAAGAAVGRAAFIAVVERVLDELYDPHAHLGTSTPASHRLVPTDADLLAAWRDGRASIVAVRAHSQAETAGLREGMQIIEIDGRPVADAIDAAMPKHLTSPDPRARDWALNVALAGL